MDTAILVLFTPLAIVAIVNFLKSWGVPPRVALLVAGMIVILASLADHLFGMEGWYGAVYDGLVALLAAAGLYDTSKTVASKPAPEPQEEIYLDDEEVHALLPLLNPEPEWAAEAAPERTQE